MNNKTEPNVILDQSKKTSDIRAEAIKALQSGADFVLLVMANGVDDAQELNLATSMHLDDLRICLNQAAHDVQYLRPGMNN